MASSLLTIALLFGPLGSYAQPAITQELVDEINAKQSSWTAHMSPRFQSATLNDVKMLCGTIMKDDPKYANALDEKVDDETWLGERAIPLEFDVRKQWPKCASVSGDIRDQSSCGSCWAFGSTEAFNDRNCIATGDTTLLSPTDTVGNCGFISCFSLGCNGGHPGMAWHWFTRVGVVSGGDESDKGKGDTCAPYPFPACAHHVPNSTYPACPKALYKTPEIGSSCSEKTYNKAYSADKRKAAKAYSLGSVAKIQQDMIQYGSVTGAFTVYADFPAYKSGVYHHTTGSYLGGHAIKIMGWGTENGEDYWLVANSWNPTWGDNGTFKIRRGTNECGIEGMVTAGTAMPSQESVLII